MKDTMYRFRLPATAGLLLLAALAHAAINAPMKVDHRGLIEIPGVLRGNSEHHWGAANLIVYGPSWNFSAQDYALKNIKRTGSSTDVTLTGDLGVGGTKVRVEQQSKMIKRADGSSAMRMTWKMVHPEGKPLNIQKAYVQFPFATTDFAGATLTADNGKTATFPQDPGDIPALYGIPGLSLKGKTKEGRDITFRLTGKNLNIEFHDGRKETKPFTAYLLRLLLPDTKNASSSEVTFEINAAYPPFTHKPGPDWVAFPFTNDVKPGSILDFSSLNPVDAPAGKHGRIINKGGHYALEKTGQRIRLIGANLCFGANFLEKHEADALAAQFRRLGYNTVRFHHTDVTLMKGGWDHWNPKKVPVEIDPAQLDKLDYMFAAMKNAGLYITFDLYAMGLTDVNGKGIRGELKALLPIDDDVFNAWTKNVLIWMNHVNPYTRLAWKDDPAIVNICPVNEDSIASVWTSARDRYDAAFADWKKTAPDTANRTDDQLKARFLTELKVASNKKIETFLRKNGVKALLSGSNWWNTQAQTFERDALDVVDHHQYADHPQPHYLPRRYNQKTNLRERNPTYMTPVMMMPNRIFGKPFIVTEYNFCPPNQYRAEAGALVGAYASLQDWDALYRFAWSHSETNIRQQRPIDGFDIATDPVSLLTERQIALLFARRDVAPAKEKYVYAVTMDEATEQGIGNMWGRGLFPHPFTALGLIHQIGSQVAQGNRTLQGKFTAAVAAAPLPPQTLAGNKFIPAADLPKAPDDITSDTGQITLNLKSSNLRVNTPKTACLVAPDAKPLTAGPLTVSGATTFCSVSASAMDGRDLAGSQRILLFHITNVVNTDMQFADASMTTQHAVGSLPYLAKTGSATLTLRNPDPNLRLYPLRSDGTRMAVIPAPYANGAYTFTLSIAPGAANPTMLYELSR